MPSAAVAAAFDARLLGGWTVGPIATTEQVDPPADANSFLLTQYPVVNGSKPVLKGRYWEEGAARLVLQVKRGMGLTQGLAWADTLAALFRSVKFAGVETFVPSAPIVNDANDDGNWFELAVIVPYRYQFDA